MLSVDRFTEGAQEIAARAMEIMQRYGHDQMDSEHILLALLEQPEGAIQRIFEKLNVDQERMKQRLDEALRAATETAAPAVGPGQVFITPRVSGMLALADEESQGSEAKLISTEHFLLALLSERDTAVAGILSEGGVSVGGVQRAR